jgi:hypothetical protein
MAIQKKTLTGAASSRSKEAAGASGKKPDARPEQPEKLAAARKLAVAKLATAKLSTAKLMTLRKLS